MELFGKAAGSNLSSMQIRKTFRPTGRTVSKLKENIAYNLRLKRLLTISKDLVFTASNGSIQYKLLREE
jgi:hypothetical protein